MGVEAVEAGLFDNIAVGSFRGIEANGVRSFFSGFVAGGGQQQDGAYGEGKDPMREKGCFHDERFGLKVENFGLAPGILPLLPVRTGR